MNRLVWTAVAMCFATGIATSQWWGDTFDTNALTGWTLDRGAWTATNMRAQADATSTWQYATRTDLVYENCVVECDATHPGTGLAFAGVALRVNDPMNGSLGRDLIMVKLQGTGGFTDMWLYHISALGQSQSSLTRITQGSLSGRVRLSAIGTELVAEWDTDQDGTWDQTSRVTTSVTPKPGPVGINGFRSGIVDNFMMYNAVIMPDTTSPAPNPGNTVLYDVGGQSGHSFQGAIALGNLGLPLGVGRSLPLTPDDVFLVSAQNLLGNLNGVMDTSGTGTLGFRIPNLQQLVGVTYHVALVTYDATGLTGISNDVRTTIS